MLSRLAKRSASHALCAPSDAVVEQELGAAPEHALRRVLQGARWRPPAWGKSTGRACTDGREVAVKVQYPGIDVALQVRPRQPGRGGEGDGAHRPGHGRAGLLPGAGRRSSPTSSTTGARPGWRRSSRAPRRGSPDVKVPEVVEAAHLRRACSRWSSCAGETLKAVPRRPSQQRRAAPRLGPPHPRHPRHLPPGGHRARRPTSGQLHGDAGRAARRHGLRQRRRPSAGPSSSRHRDVFDRWSSSGPST